MLTIKLRRDHSLDWMRINPILANGEPGFETDTGRFKIGNGVNKWLELEYFYSGTATPSASAPWLDAITDHINSQMPHPIYDDGPSLLLLYQNAKV